MVIDSHMHINSMILDDTKRYIEDINKNLKIKNVVNVGLDITTSKESVLISNANEKFYSTVGIHPLYIDFQDINSLYEISDNSKVVAIGEIGLDTIKDNFYEQKKYLVNQIIIANELHLPVVIHSNNTNKLIIEIFENYIKPKYGCVFHCFQPDIDDLNYIIKNGYYISFAGKITYKNAKKSIEVAKLVPNELFLIETDSPYISPEPFREKINRSKNIKYIIEKLSEVKEMDYYEIENINNKNVKRLFKRLK